MGADAAHRMVRPVGHGLSKQICRIPLRQLSITALCGNQSRRDRPQLNKS